MRHSASRLVSRLQMAPQIPGVMKEAKNFYHVVVAIVCDAEHHEMTRLAGDVKRE